MAFAVTLILTPAAIAVLRGVKLLDVPNGRSSHQRAMPRGGGLAPALGLLVALLIASSGITGSGRVGLVLTAGGFALLGLADDVIGVPPLPRLGVQVVVAAISLPWLLSDMSGPALWQIAFAVGVGFWLIAYVNAFNFMDGIDGISAAQVLVAGAAWYLIGSAEGATPVAAASAMLVGASLAFGPFNFPRARVFLGDVGSYFLGAFLAVVAVMGLRAGLAPEAVLGPLALYLADTGTTLVRRLVRGETCYLPHREHVYQQLIIRGWSHPAVTCLVAVLIAACSALGALSLTDSAVLRVLGDIGVIAVLGGYVTAPEILERSSRGATTAH